MDMDDANELLQDFIDRRAARIDWKARAERAEAALRALVEAMETFIDGLRLTYGLSNTFVVLNSEVVVFREALEQARAVLPQSPEEEA
jgi:hypothetical protein